MWSLRWAAAGTFSDETENMVLDDLELFHLFRVGREWAVRVAFGHWLSVVGLLEPTQNLKRCIAVRDHSDG